MSGPSASCTAMAAKKHSSLDRVLGRLDALDSVNLANLVQRLARERGLFEDIFNTLQEGILVVREVLKQAPAGFSAATKCFCTEHEARVADFVAQVLGPEAMLWDDVTRGLAYAPGYTIMGGTSNVMRNILGDRVLGLPR